MATTAMAAETPPPPASETQASHALKSVSELDSRKLDVDPETLPGAAVFRDHCAQCHLGQVPKAPQKMFLQMMSGPTIHEALNAGLMRVQAQSLTEKERAEVAEYLSGGRLSAAQAYAQPKMCTAGADRFDLTEAPLRAGWGYDNSRFINAGAARLPVPAMIKLRLAWAFEFPGGIRARSQPSIAYGAVYVGSYDGTVYALDEASGCVRWAFKAGAEVRTGVVPYEQRGADGKLVRRLFFGDVIARIYSIDALTGKLAWSIKVDDHPNATITATPTFSGDAIYVPVSSLEVTSAADVNYECCKFRGAVVSLDARSGAQRWKAYAIPQVPVAVKTLASGKRIFAPSGAPIWNSPMVDPKRGLLYVGTGENYSSPASDTSDSVLAFRLNDGAMVWSYQAFAGDAWNVGCMMAADHPNCPAENGPDVDFGAGTVLATLPSGGDILIAAQKNGWLFGLDPDHGRLLWKTRVGRGGIQGGIHFGVAVEGTRIYAGISDMKDEHTGRTSKETPRPGITAVDAASGKVIWTTPATDVCAGRAFCDSGISAAVTAVPGAVIAGHMDGRLRVYDGTSGALLKEFDTTENVLTTSGATAHGGSFGGPGAAIRDGYVVVNSGYGIYFHMPGNVLLAYRAQ